MSPVGFEPTISAGDQQTYALDRAATGNGLIRTQSSVNRSWKVISVVDSKLSPNAKASIIEEHYSCC